MSSPAPPLCLSVARISENSYNETALFVELKAPTNTNEPSFPNPNAVLFESWWSLLRILRWPLLTRSGFDWTASLILGLNTKVVTSVIFTVPSRFTLRNPPERQGHILLVRAPLEIIRPNG